MPRANRTAGIAFAPNFATNNFIYVYYTATTSPRHNRVSVHRERGRVVAGSEVAILDLEELSATNHNGGAIHLAPTANLCSCRRECSPGKFPTQHRLGKILVSTQRHSPSDIFFHTPEQTEHLALGLRNPYTFAFSRRLPDVYTTSAKALGKSTMH